MKILTFNDWWEINHIDYEKAGVSKVVAKTIWAAAVDAGVDATVQLMKEHYDKR